MALFSGHENRMAVDQPAFKNTFVIVDEDASSRYAQAVEAGNNTEIKAAEVFFEIAGVKSDKWTVMKGVAHPSFGNWHKSKYKDVIEEVKKVIEKTN